MNARLRNSHESLQLGLVRQAKLQPLRSHAQAEERRDVYCKTVT